ncbi:hypothetical protein [Caldinitratiruptor microaerophilus]|uniref:Uncharacterized protein n=1 Tax=Caldinitratiruptor microaerophilus TaxID=671077 RepID=A0AA35G9Y1_9FIRM|nr:hypothetical protein [Caldinitratiruptor microaerophilus]BDG61953.1 hypothetical protein caldi_30430 [Caldinitratiruptor microaerophilus]
MLTYRTCDGRVLDLSCLTEEERQHFERAYQAYRNGMAAPSFSNEMVHGMANPLVGRAGGWVTREVYRHPLFQALRDLEDRLGLAQGYLEPAGEDLSDPLEDEWIPAPEAARRKGVTLMGLHNAIRRGDVIARPAKPGGRRLLVSCNSLGAWKIDEVRQANAKARAPT